jgi:hypothetical protein
MVLQQAHVAQAGQAYWLRRRAQGRSIPQPESAPKRITPFASDQRGDFIVWRNAEAPGT